uniref:Uncharacterized protein n=1 Tax=Bactrocera latifrons TaxID=174628 RepID=A0A0K8W1V0_BACLA
MDEIEYLEEYEDLILPTMSTQTATTKGRNRTNLVTMPDDEDSSSIDQDIFDSLFDDNSDDESVMHKKGPAKLSQRSEHSSRYSRVSMDSLDMLVKELGEPFNPNTDGSKSTNKPQPKQSNVKVTQPNKTVQKSTTTTTMTKGTNSPTPASSVSMKTNKTEAAKTIVERNNKTKSVATVRPTVQQNQGQASASTKIINSNDNALPTTRILQSNRSCGIQNAKITSGSTNSAKGASPTPSTSRKQISAATSTTSSNSNSLNSSKHNTPITGSKRIIERSQTTIIKPEKPQIKDPAEDPLSLENIENESDSDTDSFIYSDVSADTFVTLSDVDYDERHIIELSNDSNYERANLDTHKKCVKATANQTPISANVTQKLQKEQPNSSRNATATPTTNLTRKRMRDLTPNTLDENNEQEKSLSKKLKWESVRKSSRIHHDDVDTSEGEPDAAALAQRGVKSFSAKESPASMSAQEKQGKSTKSGKSISESATNVATKHSTVSEVKQSLTGDNLKTSKTREKAINTSQNANKTHTPEMKRKQEYEKLPTTTTSTEPGKKRRADLENAQQSAKKLARANDETTQQQKNTMSKSAVKQAPSTSTGTPTAVTLSMATEDTDPLQLPVKRFKRLQAIDGYDTLNISEERKEIKAEELDHKNVTSKRKSLRAAGPTDSTKTAETAHKSTPKQQIQQQQQQQRAVPAKQVEATTTVSLKDRKIAVPNRTGEDAMSSSSKSPTKSPGSKVITFKEWLEQQKKNTSEDGGEEVLFEPDESAIRMDNVATATTAEPNRGNLSSSEVRTVAEQKPNETTVVQTVSTEVSASKSSTKKTNVRDANKRKRQTEAASNETKEGVANELPKQTPPAAKHGRIEKVVTPAAAQFKRPSLPQRVSRLTPSRFNNRPSTQTDGRAGVHGTHQHLRKLTVQRFDAKMKLRKLRVRINRSTVAAYFKNLNLKVKEQVVENPVISTSHSVTDIILSESEAKATEPSQKRSSQKDQHAPAKKRIVSQPTTATTPLQLPTLTARPNVISAAENNDALKSSPATMPALTKVPPSVEQKSPTKSQENTDASQTETADQQFGSTEELSLLTPMKCVTVPQSTNNSSRSQQQQQQPIASTGAEVMREKRSSTASSSDASVTQRSQSTGKQTNSSSSSTITAASTASIANDTQLPFTPVVPKEEVVDEHTTPAQQAAAGITSGASADNAPTTNSLASRTLAIAAATTSALNQTPTNDPSGYYGLTPTQLDSNGTRLYSFLHPAKYNRNHGCVLLDYCCPNLDGPMPAIDPTRIHAQVQAGVRELPAYIVMSTKLITRADLEANKNVIPASIRQKVEKITADATNIPTNQTSVPTIANGAPNTAVANVTPVAPPVPVSKPTTSTTALTPTITALQKHLPSTTVITPKLMPSTSTPTMATLATSQLPTVSDYQRSLLRTSIRQFDARLKKYYYRIAMLSFSERQTIIDSMINSTTLTPKDVDCAVRLIDEYAAQIAATTSPTNVTSPAIQSVSKAITTQTTNTVVRTTTIQQQSQKSNLQSSKTQVAVLDKDNSLLGYQLAASPMPMNKSSISTRSSIMSTSITGSMNTSLPTVTTTSSIVLPTLKATQASPRIFYTKPPMQTSTPIATTTSNANTPLNDGKTTSLRSTPRMGRELTIRQIPQKLNSVPVSSSTASGTLPTRRLPTLTRNPHLTAGSSAEKSISETITTRSAVTISTAPKRMTRATAAAKVVVITQNTDGNGAPQDECILPDGHENTEIKREKVDDDFVGGN